MADFEGMAKALQIPQSVLDNLDKVDEKINKIASDSDKMANAFKSAMKQMGDDSGNLLKKLTDIQGILGSIGNTNASGLGKVSSGMEKMATEGEKATNALAKAAEAVNKFGNSGMNIAELRQTIKGINDELRKGEGVKPISPDQQYLVNLRKILQDELKEQEKSNSQREAEHKKMLERIQKEEEKAAQRRAKLDSRLRRSNYQDYVTSTEGSLRTAGRATNYNERAQAIKNLEAAMKRLNVSDANYQRDLNRLTEAHKKLIEQQRLFSANLEQVNKRQSNLVNTSQQLARQLALLFSVSQIEGYIMKLVRVRGEFELQNTALASILGNKEQADRLFAQITDLAVQSPFTIKELTTYTKSLSAYSVEYEKLYDTTKMLADVSSGLGVDMQRLILAFGQVKAANFLRGCLGYDTPIMLFDGTIKKVQDIEVGDILINENGEAVNVLELIRGRETMYLVEQVSGKDRFSYRVNRNHILTLWNVQEQRLEDVYVYDYLKNKEAYLGLKIANNRKVYYDIEVTKDRIDDYFGFVLDGNKRFRLGDGTITHNTETRQFTEAGINMLGELAKYYSELEGRIVSVSEVQDRQFKRMISFQDVEQVFKRLTSEGGMFYNMQERQAETLAGVYSNLQDKIDLMLNEIGKANDGLLKGTIKTIGSILENYEAFINAIQIAGGVFVLYRLNLLETSTALLRYAKAQGIATAMQKQLNLVQLLHVAWNRLAVGIKASGAALKAFAASNLWLIGITALVTAIYELVTWNDEYNAQIDEINKKHSAETASLIKLSEAYDKVTKSAKESNDAQNPDSESYKSRFAQLQKLNEMLEDRGYTLPIKIEFVTPENIDEAFQGGKQILQAASDFSTEFQKALAVEMNATEGWGHIFGDNLKTDLKDLSNSYSEVGGAFKANLDILENEVIVASKGLEGAAKKYYEELRAGQKAEETNTEWAIRRLTLISNINDLIRIQNNSTESGIKHEEMLNDLLSTRTEIRENEREVEYELSKVLDKFIKDYGGLENLKKRFNDNPILIKTEIDRIFEAMELDAQTKRFAAHFAANRLQVPIELVPADTKTPEFFNDWRDTVKALDTEGIFDKQLQSMRSIADLEDAIQKKYKEINDELSVLNRANTERLDLNKQIEEAESQLLNPDAQIAENARITLDNLLGQKEVIEANISESTKKLNTMKQVVEVIARAFNLLLTKSAGGGNKDPMLDRFKEVVRLIEEAKKRYDELNKEFGSKTATQMVRTQYADTAVGDLIATMTFDAQGVINGIEQALQATGKAAQEEYNKVAQNAMRPYETKLLLEPQIEKREQIEKEIEKMFSQYELSIQLKSTGVSDDIIKELFNTDIINLDTLKAKLIAMRPILEAQGLNWQEVWEETEKKLTEATEKETEERLKRYAEYMKKSISERTRIELEAQEEIAKVQSMKELSPNTKEAVSRTIRKNADIEIGKLDWQDFQGSEIYQKLFSDLEYLSTASIERIKLKLDELKNSMGELSPENLKAINEYYSQIEDQLAKRNPFAAMQDSLAEINKLRKEGKTEESLQSDLINLDADASLYRQQIQDLELIIGMKEKGLSLDGLNEDLLNRNNKLLGKSTEDLRMLLNLRQGQLDSTKTQIGVTQKDLNSYSTARKNAVKLKDEIQNIKDVGAIAFGSISEIMDSMGAGMSENDKIIADMTGGIIDMVAQAVMLGIQMQINSAETMSFGAALNAALGPIGWAVMGLQALTALFTGFSKIHDNKIQKQIEAEQDKIDNLNRTYEKLQDTIENGLSIFQYSESGNQIDILLEQIKSYERMIDLERDKKKSDKNSIKNWRNDIEDLYDQIDEIYNNVKENLVGSFKDAASQLADSLAEAFENGEDAAKSWGDTVNNIIADIIKNAIATKLIEPLLQPLLDNFFAQAMPKTEAAANFKEDYNKAQEELYEVQQQIESSSSLSPKQIKDLKKRQEELQEYVDNMAEQYESLNEAAIGEVPTITEDMVNDLREGTTGILDFIKENGLLSMLDDLVSGAGDVEGDMLGSLQKGIQGITEETAQALEALLESIRFFVSDENSIIHNIYNWLIAPPAETPLMQELKLQTSHLASIDSLLNSVIKSSSGKGKIMRVEIV